MSPQPSATRKPVAAHEICLIRRVWTKYLMAITCYSHDMNRFCVLLRLSCSGPVQVLQAVAIKNPMDQDSLYVFFTLTCVPLALLDFVAVRAQQLTLGTHPARFIYPFCYICSS